MTPRLRGSYVLVMRLREPTSVAVGQLGEFEFPAGWYTYAGGARGPGGLASRVDRHQRASKTLHWHVDYLRAHADVLAVWYAVGRQRRECRWAQALCELPGASMPAPRFGASDCRCRAHLVHFPDPPNRPRFARSVDEPVHEEVLGA